MTSDERAAEIDSGSPVTNPWPLMLVSLGLAVVAFFLHVSLLEGEWELGRVVLILSSLLLGAGAVWAKPRHAGVLAVAAAVSLLNYMAMDSAWDSAKMVVAVLAMLAAFSAVVMALPLVIGPEAGRIVGRVLVSLFIVYHFGGILVAVASVTTPAGTLPWVPSTLWTYVYRPYLQFMYMSNAYHFYSPEPGPACLIWARIEYADQSSRWIKIPNREEHFKDPLGQEYLRRLSLTESINQLEPITYVPENLRQHRYIIGRDNRTGPIGMNDAIPLNLQYRKPNLQSRKMLSCVAQYMARNFPHPTNPEVEFASVKIYRVVHQILRPADLVRYDADGNRVNRIQLRDVNNNVYDQDVTPDLHTLYQPFFQGEYDRNGEFLQRTAPDGTVLDGAKDPLLYWLIPIIPRYETHIPPTFQTSFTIDPRLLRPTVVGWDDYLTIHAGSDPWGDMQ